MESQLEFYDEGAKYRDKIQEVLPGVKAAHAAFREEVYMDGALSLKVKRLIALGIALRAVCPECIIAQTRAAVEAGATKAEVLETISVATVMGGTPASGSSWRAIKVLEELGKW